MNQAQFITLSLTAITSLGVLFRSLFKIVDLLTLLKQDFLNNPSLRSRGIYSGHLTSPSHQENPSLQILISFIQDEKSNSFHSEKDLYLLEGNSKLLLTKNTLEKSGLDWPITNFKITSSSSQNQCKNDSNLKNIINWGWASVLSFLGLSAKINFDYCERGLKIGSKVFLYGHIGDENNMIRSIEVEYLSDSADLLKNYLKEKIIKHTALSLGVFSVLLLSGFYLWRKFDFTVPRTVQTEEGIEAKPKTEIAKTADYISNHYPIYKSQHVKSKMKCGCKKYFVNVINFPCSHFDSCFACFAAKSTKTCSVCHELILDYFILQLS